MLQLEAAAALAQVRPEIAAEVVERALASPNVWVRGQAASVAARLGYGWSERVRGILEQDSSSWVRLQAATGVLRR